MQKASAKSISYVPPTLSMSIKSIDINALSNLGYISKRASDGANNAANTTVVTRTPRLYRRIQKPLRHCASAGVKRRNSARKKGDAFIVLTFKFTRRRKRAKPAVAGRVECSVGRQYAHAIAECHLTHAARQTNEGLARSIPSLI